MINGKPVDVKTMSFILIVPGDKNDFKDDLNQVEMIRKESQKYLNEAVAAERNAAGQTKDDPDYDPSVPDKFDTSLDPDVH